ncbi:MAG TPA: outer membrane protein [Microvirga sp.]|nr:outer membrane protein [Microvirga sp.]
MKRALLASTALMGLTVSAMAADLPYRSSPASYGAPPVFTWTGFHLGLNAGAIWANGSQPRLWDAAGAPFPGAITRDTPVGVSAGGTAGYNFQLGSNFVAGVEADLAWANADRKSQLLSIDRPDGVLTVTTAEFSNKLEYYVTARARLGFLATPSLLVYATGGLAYADVKHAGFGTSVDPGDAGIARGSKSSTKWGYALGAGLEYALTGNWSVKGEYLYVGLTDTKYSLNDVADGAPMAAVKEKNDFSTVRLGLNYRFGAY